MSNYSFRALKKSVKMQSIISQFHKMTHKLYIRLENVFKTS